MLATVFYCMIMVVNGGMCGAFGPSLDFFERQTDLSQGVLGGAVMQNRLAKLGATPRPGTQKDLGELIQTTNTKMAKVIRESNIQGE